MATVTATLTVNAAFLREIKDDNRQLQELLSELRGLTRNDAVAVNHRRRILRMLGDLRDQLAFHFTLESAYGYFDEAIDVAPHIAARADALQNEHVRLYERIRRIADRAEQLAAPRRSADVELASLRQLIRQFHRFDKQLARHERDENALILEALDTDIGGEGG